MINSRGDTNNSLEAFAAERARAGGSFMPGAIDGVPGAVVKFTQIDTYTTFLVEFAMRDADVIIHFFPPVEVFVTVPGTDRRHVNMDFLKKWQRHFPQILSPTAEAYFQRTFPVISAEYVPELSSWYMRCAGFAERLDPDGFVRGFFEKLDAAIDASHAF